MRKLKFGKKEICYGREIMTVETDYDEEITAIVSRNDWAPLPGGWKEFHIARGGLLKIIGGDPEKGTYKVEYKAPSDSQNNNGRVFEIFRETFLAMQAENKIVKYFEKLEKRIIRNILMHPYKKDQIIIKKAEKDEWIKVKNLEPSTYNLSKLIETGNKLITLRLVGCSCGNFYLVKYENPDTEEIRNNDSISNPSGTIFWRTIHFEKRDDLFDDITSQK